MRDTGLPDGVTQSDYERYVADMEQEPAYDPDDATLADMETEQLSAKESLALQERVFSASYIDSVLLDGRLNGDKSRSELTSIAAAGGVLEDGRATMFGSRAQSAMSYYVLQRLDEIHVDMDKASDGRFYVQRDGLKGLYADYRELDAALNVEQNSDTSVLLEGVDRLLLYETGRTKDMDMPAGGVHYPPSMRYLFGNGPWTEPKNMADYVSDMAATGKKFNELAPYQAAIKDRYFMMLPGAMDDEAYRDRLFGELADACDAMQSPVAASLGDVVIRNEPESVTRALLGYSASRQVNDLGFGEYMRERGLGHELDKNAAALENNREIKNVPDFKDNNNERSEDYGYES